MKPTIAASALLLVLAGAVVAQTRTVATPETPNQPVPSLTVSADANVNVDPDQATVQLGVTNQAETAKKAIDLTNTAANKIIEALRRVIPDRKAIQTSGLNLQPLYANQEGRAPRITGYQASYTVTVRVDDLTKVGPVVDAAERDGGANTVDFIQFGLKNAEPARLDALARAAETARAKAQRLATSLGVRLDGLLSVDEGGQGPRPLYKGDFGGATLRQQQTTPVEPGQVGVNASVSLIYRIAQ